MSETQKLFQLRILHFRGNQNWNIRVGVFPHCEKVLIGGAGFGGVALENVGASDVELGHGVEDANDVDAAVIENFLEFGSDFCTVVKLEVSPAAGIGHSKFSIACAKFVFFRRL